MAEAIEKIIADEIEALDERMSFQAYHRAVLTSLLSKINLTTGEVSISGSDIAEVVEDLVPEKVIEDLVPVEVIEEPQSNDQKVAKKVDPDVDWLVPLPISSKPEVNRINRARRLELSVIVARMVKSQGYKKVDAVRELYRRGDINRHEFINLPRQISRSHLGSDHDLLFEGTKYANKK